MIILLFISLDIIRGFYSLGLRVNLPVLQYYSKDGNLVKSAAIYCN